MEIYRFKILLKDKGMDQISLHSHPIERVTYMERLEKVLSYDRSRKAVVWDINTLNKCQVIVFEHQVNRFFSFCTEPSILVLGSQTFLLEKVGLADHFGEFLLFEVVFDFSLKRFLILTNQEIRYLDYIDGGLQKISIHNCRNFIFQEKFLRAITTSQGHSFILGFNENRQFSLYNLNTLEKVRDVQSEQENRNENPSCIYFIDDLDLLAVGYEESKIKGLVVTAVFDINNKNLRVNCIKVCLQGHENSSITSLNFFDDSLVSGSKNGMIVLWNLYNNSVTRIPHYTRDSIVRLEVINNKTFLALTNKFKVYMFKKSRSLTASQLVSTSFECSVIINLQMDSKIDRIISSCRVMKTLWLGTEKGRLVIIDFNTFFEQNNLRAEDFYSDISGPRASRNRRIHVQRATEHAEAAQQTQAEASRPGPAPRERVERGKNLFRENPEHGQDRRPGAGREGLGSKENVDVHGQEPAQPERVPRVPVQPQPQ